MPRIDRRLRKRKAGAASEEKYGGTHGIVDFLISCGLHEPTAELERDVEAYSQARPELRKQLATWLRDNAEKFAERQARRRAEAIG